MKDILPSILNAKTLAIAGVLLTTMLTGCATQQTLINQSSSQTLAYSKSQSFYFDGIGQQQTVDAKQVCGGADKVASVENSLQAKDILLGAVTLGIYTPRTTKVYCH